MNTPRSIRLASALASVAITFSLLTTIATMARPQAGDAVLLAQAATVAVR